MNRPWGTAVPVATPVRVANDGAPGREDRYIDIEIGRGRRVRVAPGVATEDLRRVLAVLDERTPC